MKLPKIGIWSIFRDNAGRYIQAYSSRINSLDYPRRLLRFYLSEGDSIDNTFNELVELSQNDSRISVCKANSGFPYEAHTTSPKRFKSLELVNNAALEAIVADNWAEVAVLIESDLPYEPDLLKRLLANRPTPNSVIAPMIWLRIPEPPGYRFYDVWAFRWTAEHNFPFDAYYYDEYIKAAKPFPVESAGSIVMFPMNALRSGCRYDDEVIRGMCLQAGRLGHPIYADPTINVFHPPED